MEILLLGIYSFFVWIIFIKKKWLPWNITSQVIVVTLPIIGLTALILMLNLYAPSSHDVRVLNYTVQIIPNVTGRVIELDIEPNQPVKKGDILFKIDPVPFELGVKVAEAKIPELEAKLESAKAYDRELEQQLKAAEQSKEAVKARLDLATMRTRQTKELAEAGAGSRFEAEQAAADESDLKAQFAEAEAKVSEILSKISAKATGGELSEIAQARAALQQGLAEVNDAKWKLDQTVVYAPANGRAINLQLRVGSYAAAIPLRPVMSFVEDEQWLMALYSQNELREIEPGNEAEVALKTYPGKIIKCKVESIVWATGQGQAPFGGDIPDAGTTPIPPGRFAVRLLPEGVDKELFLASGAMGQGAIYTNSGKMIHILRKVILRVGTKMDWFIFKLH